MKSLKTQVATLYPPLFISRRLSISYRLNRGDKCMLLLININVKDMYDENAVRLPHITE